MPVCLGRLYEAIQTGAGMRASREQPIIPTDNEGADRVFDLIRIRRQERVIDEADCSINDFLRVRDRHTELALGRHSGRLRHEARTQLGEDRRHTQSAQCLELLRVHGLRLELAAELGLRSIDHRDEVDGFFRDAGLACGLPGYFSSRSFATFDELQAGMRKWLLRVNTKLSQATGLMPLADFEANEKPALRPQRASLFRAEVASGCRESRKVDQKSLISVAATRYSVPSSYRLKEVEIERRDGLVLVFDAKTGTQIAAHREATTPGLTVVDKAHYRDRESSQEKLREDLVAAVADLPEWTSFVDSIYTEYRRYFREHAARLRKLLERNIDREKLTQALTFCLDWELASAQDLIDAVDSTTPVIPVRTSPYRCLHHSRELPVVATRSVGEYQRFFDAAIDTQGHEE